MLQQVKMAGATGTIVSGNVSVDTSSCHWRSRTQTIIRGRPGTCSVKHPDTCIPTRTLQLRNLADLPALCQVKTSHFPQQTHKQPTSSHTKLSRTPVSSQSLPPRPSFSTHLRSSPFTRMCLAHISLCKFPNSPSGPHLCAP